MNEQDRELLKQVRLYLGKENWDILLKITKKEMNFFKTFPLNMSKTYFVIGKRNTLEKFRAFYLTRSVKNKPIYRQYHMYEYASVLSGSIEDSGLIVDVELLFLDRHNQTYELGNTDKWLNEVILSKVADRNRDRLVTVILSEIPMPTLENSGEFEIINLIGSSIVSKKADLSKFSNGTGSTDQEHTDYSS